MRIKSIRFISLIVLSAAGILLLFLSCTGVGPTGNGNNTGVPQSGDDDYVPPGWSEPSLAYEKSAYFPSEVLVSAPHTIRSPGQYVNSVDYGLTENTEKLLGPPVGGGVYSPDNSSVVSLGMAGGAVTVRFAPPIENHPDNIGGYDFIVFGNAYWSGGNPENAWREPGIIWVMEDENGDGEPNDMWYLIAGSHHSGGELLEEIIYSASDDHLPPPSSKKESWWPDGVSSPLELSDVFILPDNLYSTGGGSTVCWGYGDLTPTLLLGDFSGAGVAAGNTVSDAEDYPGIDPVYFYTTPDTHGDRVVDPGSGGGDAIKLEWAVDPVTFESVTIDRVSWIKIVGATLLTDILGEYSCEVDSLARVRRSE